MGLNHACNSCGGGIEFAPEHTGLQVNCPHCGMLTVLATSALAAMPPFGGPPQAPGPQPPQQQMPYGGMGVPVPIPQPVRGGVSTGGIIAIVAGALVAVSLIVFGIIMLSGEGGGGGGSAKPGIIAPSKEVSEKEDLKQYVEDWETRIIPCINEEMENLDALQRATSNAEKLRIYGGMIQQTRVCNRQLSELNPATSLVRDLHRKITDIRDSNLLISRKYQMLMISGRKPTPNEAQRLQQDVNVLMRRIDSWFKEVETLSRDHGVPLDRAKWDSMNIQLE